MRPETEAQWAERKGVEILRALRGRILTELPFFALPLSAFVFQGEESLRTFATDGTTLFFPGEHLIELSRKNELFLTRMYLHTTLHCLFAHLWLRGDRDERLWNLACDIAVEGILDRLEKGCTIRAVTLLRRQVYEVIRAEQAVSAGEIYGLLSENRFGISTETLEREFFTDDHRYWQGDEAENPVSALPQRKAEEKWRELAKQTELSMRLSGDDPEEYEEALASLLGAEKRRRSYSDFLKRFASLHEELTVSEEEFDLAYYTYGLSVYGNLPLIEPLETREEYRIRDFVIAVDTSDSTSGELVRQFLGETFSVLLSRESFFRISEIHVLQADDRVRSDQTVKVQEDAARLMRDFTLFGGGSTDFRPVFTYVEEQRKQGKLRELGGLLYFTDGRGPYPKQRPAYKTAFLFCADYDEAAVPPWAYRLRLRRESNEHRGSEAGD